MTGGTSTAIATSKLMGYAGAIAVFNYVHVPQEQMAILAALMFADFLTGVAKQYRVDASKITSHNAWLGIIKKVTTLMVPFVIGLLLRTGNIDGKSYVTSALSILIMAEGYSIIQNIYAIRTGKILPEFDVISQVLKTISEFIKDKLDRMTKIQAPKRDNEEE